MYLHINIYIYMLIYIYIFTYTASCATHLPFPGPPAKCFLLITDCRVFGLFGCEDALAHASIMPYATWRRCFVIALQRVLASEKLTIMVIFSRGHLLIFSHGHLLTCTTCNFKQWPTTNGMVRLPRWGVILGDPQSSKCSLKG